MRSARVTSAKSQSPAEPGELLILLSRGKRDGRSRRDIELAQPDTDRKAIIRYFEENADSVAKALRDSSAETSWLAQRRGTGTDEAILDVYNSLSHLRKVFDDLSQVWSKQATRKPRWVAFAVAEMINHIRNNMFHGRKNPDDSADRKLLDRVNSILLGILQAWDSADSRTPQMPEIPLREP